MRQPPPPPTDGESPFEGGFTRYSVAGPPGSLVFVRDRLAAAAAGQPARVRDGLALFWSWADAAALVARLWPPALLRDTPAARRAVQRRLRCLGAPAVDLAALEAAPRGTAAHVVGRAVACAPSMGRLSHIWHRSEMLADNVRWICEEGHDFLLQDDAAAAGLVRVVAAGGALLCAASDPLRHGDRVELFGFVDRVIDPAGARVRRAEPVSTALRSGDDLPLVVRKLPETGQEAKAGEEAKGGSGVTGPVTVR
jgi:hypothetical protein